MYAGVWVGADMAAQFEVRNDLEARVPTFFNIYILLSPYCTLDLTVRSPTSLLPCSNFSNFRMNSPPSHLSVADDIVLYAASRSLFESGGQSIVVEASLTVSLPKT